MRRKSDFMQRTHSFIKKYEERDNMGTIKKIFMPLFLMMILSFLYVNTVSASGVTANGSEKQETTVEEKKEAVKLKISSAKAASVTLKWNKVNGVSKYNVFRSQKKKSGYKKIAAVKSNKNTYKDNKIKENKNYYYKVQAVFSDGSKIESNIKAKVKVKGDYKTGSVYGPSLSKKQLNQVKDSVANFVNVYTSTDMDDFNKVLAAHDYLCKHCSYETRGWQVNHANTALGALKYKKAQCSGYARAFKALCDGMGIGCRYVHANSKAYNPSHQWNLVRVDKKWYLIDVQLNDSSNGYFCFLIGKNTSNKYFGNIYKYNTKGMPSLSKKDYDISKYVN